MARAGRKKVQRYRLEFKVTAVRLSQEPGIEMQAVAAALDIQRFMLSRWRKEVREGVLRGRRGPAMKLSRAHVVKEVVEWATLHRAELQENWRRLHEDEAPVRIAPLE